MVEVGCKHTQINELVFARYTDKAIKYGINNLNQCFADVGQDITKIVHICCGYPSYFDQKNYIKADKQNYARLAPYLEDSIVDMISIEDAHCHGDLSFLSLFKKTKIILGTIDISSSKIESVEEIQTRIEEALKYIGRDNLVIAPDCGLGMLPKNILIEKIKNMVNACKLNTSKKL